MTFRLHFVYTYDVTKRNGHRSVGTLYKEVLGKIVFPMIASINSKREEVRHTVYNAIQISLLVSKFKNFGLHFLLERVLPCQYVYYFLPLLSRGSICEALHLFQILCSKVSEAHGHFVNYDIKFCNHNVKKQSLRILLITS